MFVRGLASQSLLTALLGVCGRRRASSIITIIKHISHTRIKYGLDGSLALLAGHSCIAGAAGVGAIVVRND